mmetsp:Transcript_116690/g.330081  ORF Transcript_116690/g.330081 Transcript_116690/m.330081 type:complete len:242 (-) Transcript_116690:732-1457(-)
MGSRMRMIFSSVSGGISKSYSLLEKAVTSSAFSFPSPSPSCFSNSAFRTASFLNAEAFLEALSLMICTEVLIFERVRRPSASFSCKSPKSALTPREASLSPISSRFFDISFEAASVASYALSTIASVAFEASTIASGDESAALVAMASEDSLASATFAPAPSTLARASFISLSTSSASSFFRCSSSAARRSSSSRFRLISSILCCAWCNAFSASDETFSACEPMASRCSAWASSSSLRRLS